MSSSRPISHHGRIVRITREFTTVEIVSESACSACHAKSLCGVSESVRKEIQVPTFPRENRNVGDEVEVLLKASMGLKAVWLAYVIPLFVLIAVLLGMLSFGAGELVAGLSALAAVAVYYLVIWLFRGRLQNEYVFTIQ